MLLIFSGKGGPDAALKKILQKQKNPKHYDDLNRAMRTGGQKLCANEMQNFALNHNKEIPKKKIESIFHVFIAYRNMILDPYPFVDFGVLACSLLRDLKPLGFLKEHHSRPQIWGSYLSDKGFV